MKKNIYLIIALMILFFSCQKGQQKSMILSSPSDELSIEIIGDSSMLNVVLKQVDLIKTTIGLAGALRDTEKFGTGLRIIGTAYTSQNETWQPVFGERKEIVDKYNKLMLTVTAENNPETEMDIEFRLYDEGLAFRYLFRGKAFADLVMQKESTTFSFDGDAETWVTHMSQGHLSKTTMNAIENTVERPLVIKQNDSSFLALGEAALVNYARAKFKRHERYPNTLEVALDGEVNLEAAGFVSPWRYVMVAGSPGELLEHNYFVPNLNEPNKLDDVSWIKPGKVIREVTLTTQGGKACVDFAVKHNLQYVEFDAGWYGHEYEDAADATTITVDPKRSPGPLDLHHVIAYAKERGIGIILYVNRRAMEKQLDEILPLYQSWGIAGVKYGFVHVGPQKWTIWLHDAVRKAAEHQLMVDIHDDYRPTGYSRTYPNLMTVEGIRGDEESPSVSHSITTLFTRMLAGAGDNTNCFLAERVPTVMGGKSAQMAKAIMLYSPWQFLFWYDRPEASPHGVGGAGANEKLLTENPELSFYDALPTVWDETKVLESHMEDYATVARKSADDWFVGSLAANKGRGLNVPLDFLDDSTHYEATLYFQDADALSKNRVKIESIRVDKNSFLARKLEKDSGLALIIRPI